MSDNRHLTDDQRARARPELEDVIEYRKPSLSVNWIIECRWTAVLLRHLFGNFGMKLSDSVTRSHTSIPMTSVTSRSGSDQLDPIGRL